MRAALRLAVIPFAAALGMTAACSGTLRHPTLQDAELLASRWPGTTVADLERGRSLYVRRCSGCHNLYRPQDYTPERWPRLVDEMAHKARLTGAERDDMVRFLVAVAGDAESAYER